MKKIAAVLFMAATVFFACSGPIQACELCETLKTLRYTDSDIVRLIEGSETRYQAEMRMRQAIAERRQPGSNIGNNVQAANMKSSVTPPRTIYALRRPQTENPEDQGKSQIIETSLTDAEILLGPTENALKQTEEKALMTEQSVRRAELQKDARKMKYVDAGVTASAVGAAFIPVIGPIISGGIILGRVSYGLLRDDPNDK